MRPAIVKCAAIIFAVVISITSCEKKDVDDDFLAAVRRYADTLIEHGRDGYSDESSPLFASALDPETLKLPEGEMLRALQELDAKDWGIRKNDRVLSGANVMHQENLYQVLYGLTELTGEPIYAREADASLRYFFDHCQSPATGLLVWGEHMGWDFRTDTLVQHYNEIKHSVGEGTTHEFYRPWILWERSFHLNPVACEKFAFGLWEHQVYDHGTGDFSRHARWDRHQPGRNSQYPRHGGFYIATWGAAYAATGDTVYLQAIKTILDFFERNRSETSGAIPSEVGNARSQGKMMWPHSNLSLAIDLWDASRGVPDNLGEQMRRRAQKTDSVFLKVPHDLRPDGKGFVTHGNVHTLAAEDVTNLGMRVYSDLWATGYGQATDAQVANVCYLRYRQNNLPAYRDLILAAADRYITSEPDIEFPVYPGTMGDVIFLMLQAHELTGDIAYFNRAEHFGRIGISMFLGGNALPAASTRHNHFESITREDTFMMAILKLSASKQKKQNDISLVWCDR
ncbi:MAG: hypothetical protein WEB30_07980 [Cyclobacteriaceae bacterium]